VTVAVEAISAVMRPTLHFASTTSAARTHISAPSQPCARRTSRSVSTSDGVRGSEATARSYENVEALAGRSPAGWCWKGVETGNRPPAFARELESDRSRLPVRRPTDTKRLIEEYGHH